MSSVPAELAGIGPVTQKVRVLQGFDPLKAGLGPEEYFVLSRIDGQQTIRDIILATGLPVERAIQIVTKLRTIGALLLPGETAPRTTTGPTLPRASTQTTKPPPRAPTAPPRATTQSDPPMIYDLPNPTADEVLAMTEQVELTTEEKKMILALRRLVDRHDPYMMLGVSQGADPKQLKRAYFRLSKEIHPDRYYNKKIGSFRERMAAVFEAVSRSYAKLTNTEPASGTGSHKAVHQSPQTPQEYAAELFERACELEIHGDALTAMKLFAAAVRIDGQVRYLRRAATCALAANQPKSALEYAKKAQALVPNDPSSARLLAIAFKAAGKLADAEEVLVMAMAMKSENDVLTSELRHDLAEVRRLLNS